MKSFLDGCPHRLIELNESLMDKNLAYKLQLQRQPLGKPHQALAGHLMSAVTHQTVSLSCLSGGHETILFYH